MGQVWYLIVSVPDFCLLPYFVYAAAVTASCVLFLNAAVNAAAADLIVVVLLIVLLMLLLLTVLVTCSVHGCCGLCCLCTLLTI